MPNEPEVDYSPAPEPERKRPRGQSAKGFLEDDSRRAEARCDRTGETEEDFIKPAIEYLREHQLTFMVNGGEFKMRSHLHGAWLALQPALPPLAERPFLPMAPYLQAIFAEVCRDPMLHRRRIIDVQGNKGIGKSTFLEDLQKPAWWAEQGLAYPGVRDASTFVLMRDFLQAYNGERIIFFDLELNEKARMSNKRLELIKLLSDTGRTHSGPKYSGVVGLVGHVLWQGRHDVGGQVGSNLAQTVSRQLGQPCFRQ